jgi:hypothetical protein
MPSRKSAKRKHSRRAKAKRIAARKAQRKVSRTNSKARLLRDVEKSVVSQEGELTELEDTEKIMGKKLNRIIAPGVDVNEELKKRWKAQEKEREVSEPAAETSEGLGIEAEEEAGESPFDVDSEKEADEEEDDTEGY